MNVQKIFKAGNSNVVAIPADILADLKIKTGDKVLVEKLDDDTINVKRTKPKLKSAKSMADFEKWYKTFIKENGEILDELAER